MADISKIVLPSGGEYNIKDATARSQIAALTGGDAILFMGVSTTAITDGGSESPTISGEEVTPAAGQLYFYGSEEFIWGPDDKWHELGSLSFVPDTANVIGASSTFTITQPTVALSTDATAGDGVISVATGITSASASGDNVNAVTGYANPTTETVLKGVKVTSQPSVTLTANNSTATGRITYVESQGSATTTKISASASGGAVSASGDSVTALTGLGTASTKSAIGASSTFTITQPTIALATNSSSATGRVQTATGNGTSSSTNTDWLKGVSVSNETLTIGAATLDTTYLGATASGANTAWDSKDTVTAVTGYSSPTTDTVLGTASTFSVTNPTITIASGSTGDVTVATGIGSATTKYMSATASGTEVGADGTASAITALGTPTTDEVLGTGSTITVTPTTTNIKATASGANTAWNSKDQKTAFINSAASTT